MATKGRRQRLKGDHESDVVDSHERRLYGWDRGAVRRYKRRMNKRVRREAGEALRKEL